MIIAPQIQTLRGFYYYNFLFESVDIGMDEKLALELLSLSKKIAIVSPLRYLGLDGEKKLSSIDTAAVSMAGCDDYLYVYEFTSGEDVFYEDHIIFRKIVMDDFANASNVIALYSILKTRPLEEFSLKSLMKSSGIKDFYKVRGIFEKFLSTGLLIPIKGNKDKSKSIYIPYFYHGFDPEVLIIRHLLSLGYSLRYERQNEVLLIYANRFSENLVVSYGNNEAQIALLNLKEGEKGVLVTEKSHVIHFNFIANLTLREFLGSICPGS